MPRSYHFAADWGPKQHSYRLSTPSLSQVVKVAVQSLTWEDSQIICVVSSLMSIHHGRRYLDWAHEVEVVVAQVVSELLNLALTQAWCVLYHEVVNGKCCRNRCFVSHHVEVEGAISILRTVLNKACIDNSTRGWVWVSVVVLLNEAGVNFFIDQAVEDLWVVTGLNSLNGFCYCRFLKSDDLVLIAWATDTISINSNFLGKGLVQLRVFL